MPAPFLDSGSGAFLPSMALRFTRICLVSDVASFTSLPAVAAMRTFRCAQKPTIRRSSPPHCAVDAAQFRHTFCDAVHIDGHFERQFADALPPRRGVDAAAPAISPLSISYASARCRALPTPRHVKRRYAPPFSVSPRRRLQFASSIAAPRARYSTRCRATAAFSCFMMFPFDDTHTVTPCSSFSPLMLFARDYRHYTRPRLP